MAKQEKIEVKAVVFDYGNTLMLSPFEEILRLKKAEFQKELESFGHRFSPKEIISAWTKADGDVNYPHLTHFGQEEPIIAEALKNLGIANNFTEISKKFLEIYRAGYEEVCRNSPQKAGIIDVLAHLKSKGKKLGIFSDGRKFDLSLVTAAWGLSGYFDFSIASEEIGFEKPHPCVSEVIIQKIGAPANNIAYVGDNPIRDAFAKEAGMKFILYIPPVKYRKSLPWRNYNEKSAHEPDATIRNLAELKKIIV